jgi:two-component system, OmpR family, response regulator CpxR
MLVEYGWRRKVAIVTIDSGVFCHGPEVAEKVREHLGWRRLTDTALLDAASSRFGVPTEKLERTLHGPPSFLRNLTREREKHIAYLRASLADLVQEDGQVYTGVAGHLLSTSLSHVLKVCLAGSHDYRRAQGVREGHSPREAEKTIAKDDEARGRWTQELFDRGPWDKSLYDIFIAMQDSTVDDAVAMICSYATAPVVALSPLGRRALEDFTLATRISLALVEKGHDVDVSCADGDATILISRHTLFLERLERELEEIACTVEGVHSATARPGPRYREPNMYVNLDVEVPSKVLLVDDEREFVHTLSERLHTRAMQPAIAYDGEEALAMVEAEEPEVMVLDLKMPGIDGLEVLRRVKRTHPKTEVIILTGHGSDAEEVLARELGAFAYLRKPVDIDLLTETMKAAYRKVNESGDVETPAGGR